MGQTNEFAHRMASKTIKLVDASGDPVAGKEVALKQTNHKFLFGCGIFDAVQVATKVYQKTDLHF
jgi:endo-1,4-beta-xylanase